MMRRMAAEPRQRVGGGSAVLLATLLMSQGCGGGSTAPSPVAPPPTSTTTQVAPGRTDVTIVASGVVLGGALIRPDTTEARPAIVVLHGWLPAGTNAVTVIEARARRYAEQGFVALALAMRGWPPSSGADDCGLRQPDDVVEAVRWLRTQPGVSPDRIGLVGFSQGGQVALLAATRDAGLAAVVAYYPVTDVVRWKATTANADIPNYVTTTCEPGGTAPRSPLQRADAIATPVLLVHGDRDTRVPTQQSVLLEAALARRGHPVDLLLVPGAEHGFTASEESFAQPVVDAYLAARLR